MEVDATGDGGQAAAPAPESGAGDGGGGGSGAAGGGELVGDKQKKRFEIKKYNAVALWAWDIVVEIARSAGIISWTFALSAKQTSPRRPATSARSLGAYATMRFIFTAFRGGSRPVKCVRLITPTGSFKSMGDKPAESANIPDVLLVCLRARMRDCSHMCAFRRINGRDFFITSRHSAGFAAIFELWFSAFLLRPCAFDQRLLAEQLDNLACVSGVLRQLVVALAHKAGEAERNAFGSVDLASPRGVHGRE
eukprot:CAMPEP_0185830286 /NCGR_PEP_ID=MMETSP1353-20130828/737_1 /TAXON_ID=1077150 /ORGANISM="Erythrolobus australicus, Strain CCMP3124" /LENGTH=250 /DNA_ID=CAMNT_0028528165 /DNA_START=12 /DNA_END=765 /DNA_ORIENTATION=-